ncbi:hypothetical protein CGLAMM_11455 [Acetobacteraceae bacterium EV16G]
MRRGAGGEAPRRVEGDGIDRFGAQAQPRARGRMLDGVMAGRGRCGVKIINPPAKGDPPPKPPS